MRKLLLLIFIFVSVSCYSQTKVLFADLGTPNELHDLYVYNEFLLAYPAFDTNNAVHRIFTAITQATFDSAVANGCKIIVRSTTGASGILTIAKKYYPNVLLVMSTGGYPLTELWSGELPCIVLTGAGDRNNETAYKVEFYDTYIQEGICPPEYSWCPSYSNGRIAGKLTFIRDYAIANNYDSSLWAVRYYARMNSNNRESPSSVDGFGKIDIELFDISQLTVPQDPYTAIDSVSSITINSSISTIGITFPTVANAVGYQIIRNGIVIDTVLTTTFIDNTLERTNSATPIVYQYRILGAGDEVSAISDSIQVRFRKYNKIYFK